MRNKLLAAIVALLLSTPAYAGSGTVTVLDSTGATQTFDVITDGSGNFVWKNSICDQAAAANCAGVDAGHGLTVSGEAASGSAVAGNPVLQAGSDGTDARTILTDASGRQVVVGAAATGGALAGNPVLIAGSDGTDARNLSTDTSGHLIIEPGNTANTTAWLVTGTGGTFPATQSGTWNITNISGTISLPTGASTSALQPTNAAQASTTSGQTGTMVQCAVTTSAPTYTTAQTDPLSCDTSGNLRTTASLSWANTNKVIVWDGTNNISVGTYGTAPGAVNALNVNASVTNANANGQATMANSSPVTLSSDQSVGDPCTFQAKTNVAIATSSGNTQLVAPVSGKRVYICSLVTVGAGASVQNVIEGTGAACTTANEAAVIGSTTAASGMSFAANGGFSYGAGAGLVAQSATAANGVCLLQSGTAAIAGNMTYVQK